MKSKLAMFLGFSSWFFLIFFIIYEYSIYRSQLIEHFLHPPHTYEFLFHLLVFSVPIGSTITGYLINGRKNMLENISAHKELKELYQNLVIAFANIVDAKSPWTRGHSERVTEYAISIAKEMGVEGRSVEILRTAGLLHDIGKIGTYDIILDKPDRLTDAEFALVRRHPVKGEEILKPIKGFEDVFPLIRSHHEKFDGTGYPEGLKGDEIPLLARILCVADSYDAMTSDRPYRPALGREYAIEELKRCSGTHFDPKVVDAFLRVLERNNNF